MRFLTAALALASVVSANKVLIDENINSQVCEGMYSKHDWGGSITPHIGIRLNQYGKETFDAKHPDKESDQDIKISYVIFEYKDLVHLGKVDKETGMKVYVCTQAAVDRGLCEKKLLGKFLVDSDVTNTTVYTAQLTHLGQANITYLVEKTGYYCVSTYLLSHTKYRGVVNFQNAFGQLSASEIPKLPAYGILTLCYAVTLALYGFQFFKKRKQNQILPLQKYLLAMLSFLTFDTLVLWSYFDLVNRTRSQNWFVLAYMVFLSILNSAKMTFSFFLLLCIGLGYGVVLVKLPKKIMTRCKILAGCHFVASMIYLIGSYHNSANGLTTSSSDISADGVSGSLWVLLPLIPVSITLTLYYIFILSLIRNTTANLHKQRQVIKLQLYERLFRIISLSVIFTMGGIVLSSFIFLSLSTTDVIEENWKGSFFIFDFWPSLIFFSVFLGVAWLWRPTETSYMLAVSQQVSTGEGFEEGEEGANGYQHGHEFELDDMSLMSHSDEETGPRDSFELENQNIPTDEPPKYKEVDNPDTEVETNTSNTLFELGDEDHENENESDNENQNESENENDDGGDSRLKKDH